MHRCGCVSVCVCFVYVCVGSVVVCIFSQTDRGSMKINTVSVPPEVLNLGLQKDEKNYIVFKINHPKTHKLLFSHYQGWFLS